MKNIVRYLLIAVLGMILSRIELAAALEQKAEVIPQLSNRMIIEGLYYKNEIREQDLPKLEKSGSVNNSSKDGVPCKGEWFALDQEGYLIARTSCSDKSLAFFIFRIKDKQDKKANMVFHVGFYDFKGDGIFERINDTKDRPLPTWVKEHHTGVVKTKIAKHLSAGSNDEKAPSVESYMELAAGQFEKEDYDTVLSLVDKAINLKYDHHRLYEIRAYAHQKKGQLDKALADAEQANKLDPKCFVSHYLQGALYDQLGQSEQAIAAYSLAIELKPELYDAYRSRGVIFAKIGKRKESIADFTKTVELHPDDCCAYLKRAWQYMSSNEYDLALADYTKAIKANPGFGYMERGSAYYRIGRYKEAVEDFKKAIEKRPDYDYPRLYTLVSSKRVSDEMWKSAMEEQKAYLLAAKAGSWSRTLFRYVLGTDGMAEPDLIAEAKKGKNQTEINGQLCEAYYFIGEKQAWKGDLVNAIAYYRKSIDTKASDYIEYGNAEALLLREGRR